MASGANREPQQGSMKVEGDKKPFAQTSAGALLVDSPPRSMRKLDGKLLTDSLTTLWTADKDYDPVVLIVSSVGAAQTFELYHVKGGGAASDADIISGKGQGVDVDTPQFWTGLGISKGDTLQGLADTTLKVVLAIYGAKAE